MSGALLSQLVLFVQFAPPVALYSATSAAPVFSHRYSLHGEGEAARVSVAAGIRRRISHGVAVRRGRCTRELARGGVEVQPWNLRRQAVGEGAVAAGRGRQRQRRDGSALGVDLIAWVGA